MKKHMGLIFRLTIAVAGITYLILILNWSNRVVLPDGASYRVSAISQETLTLEGVPADHPALSATMPRATLETGDPDHPRFEPSVTTTVREADAGLLLLGLGLLSPIYLIGSARWYLLMRVRGMSVTPGKTFRLTMVGVFFNMCMPGATGGDLMKAYYAAKGSSQRSVAVMSVVVDRACGLLGLVLLVAMLGLTMLDHPVVRKITVLMWAGLMGVLLFTWVYSHPVLRRKTGFDWLMKRMPGGAMLRNLDSAAVAYGQHKGALAGAVLMSMPIHLLVALSIATAGYALGITQPMGYLLGTVPVAVLVGALPISGPLGLGPMDAVTVGLLADGVHATGHQVAMMMVVYRGYAVVLGLLGAIGLLKGGIHLHPQDQTEPAADSSEASKTASEDDEVCAMDDEVADELEMSSALARSA